MNKLIKHFISRIIDPTGVSRIGLRPPPAESDTEYFERCLPPTPIVIPSDARIEWIADTEPATQVEGPEDAAHLMSQHRIVLFIYKPNGAAGVFADLLVPCGIFVRKLSVSEQKRLRFVTDNWPTPYESADDGLIGSRLLRRRPKSEAVFPLFICRRGILFKEDGTLEAAWDLGH